MSDVTNRETVETVNQILAELQQAARDGQLIQNDYYATEEEGRAAVADGETFKVQGSGDVAVYLYRRTSAAASLLLTTFPAKSAVDAVTGLIRSSDATPIESVVDGEGGIHRVLTRNESSDTVHSVREVDGMTAFLDSEGAATFYADGQRAVVGPLEVRPTEFPGVMVADQEGGLLARMDGGSFQNVLAGGVYFSEILAGVSGQAVTIHLPSLLAQRTESRSVVVSIGSASTSEALTDTQALRVQVEKLGPAAVLSLRLRDDATRCVWRNITVAEVPATQSVPVPVKVLVIGDSIINRQGAQLLGSHLTAIGFTPTFVGTLPGSASANDPNNAAGPLGEGREGWETGDFTYAQTDVCTPVALGEEAEYLASSKPARAVKNPFLRPAAEGDPAAVVRNGYVFDVAAYLSRFGLDAPDVVIYAAGTNDVRDRSDLTVYQQVAENDRIVLDQVRAALPAAKIIRTLPGTSMVPSRELVWPRYVSVMRALMDASSGMPGVSICPAWALVDHNLGYQFAAGVVDTTTGFTDGIYSDAVHPMQSARQSLFQSIAAYVAAAKLNLI